MNIDMTLGVQIINFLVSWWILKKWLFKPALAEIAADEAEVDSLERTSAHQQSILDTKRTERKAFWHDVQRRCRGIAPEIADVSDMPQIRVTKKERPSDIPIDKEALKKQVAAVAQDVVDKVRYVD